MPIKVVVQFQAKPGRRTELRALLEALSSTQLITSRISDGMDTESIGPRLRAAQQSLRAAEQPGSGLFRTLVMQDQG